MRAGVYVRISEDRAGAGLGVQRQEQDCRTLCERRGWEVAGVYVDNDVSAYRGKPRPSWSRLIDDSKAGRVQAIVCWHVDRLTRTPRELEDVIDLADRHGLELATVTGEVDLATPTGRMVARIMGAAARHESEHKAARVRRAHRQAAEAGLPHMGGRRPFGYERDRITVVEDEAAVIREAATRVLAGESLSSVARDWAARGVTTPTGVRWQLGPLRRLLCSARISGRREHEGVMVPDAWPAIIPVEQSDRLRRVLGDPSRSTHSPSVRTYLLTGLLVCSLCEQKMLGKPSARGSRRYVCSTWPRGRGCGRLSVVAEPLERYVTAVVLGAFDSQEMRRRLRAEGGDTDAAEKEMAEVEARLADLSEMFAAGEITRWEWSAARRPLSTRLERARARLVSATVPALGSDGDLRSQWPGLALGQRRAFVSMAVEKVEVLPTRVRGRHVPDPETRTRIHWRA